MLNLDKSTWQRVKFGDVVTNANVKSADPETDGIDRVIAMEHLDPGELAITRWGSLDSGTTFTRRVSAGQTLFGKRRAYQRKVAYAEFDAICSGDILTFEAIPGKLLPELLPFIVQSDPFFERAVGTSAGSLSPRTNWRDLAKFEFDLPPLDQQKRIADLLWALEDHAASLRTVIEANGSASSDFFGVSLQESTNRVSIVDRIQSATVGVVVRPTQYYTEEPGGVPALRGLNVGAGAFDLSDLVHFDQASAASLRKSTLQEGDVVVVRTGRPGDAAVVPDYIAGSNCIDLIIVRPGERLNPHFLCRFINSQECKNEIAKLSAGTAQQHFNVGALKLLSVPDTDLDAQDELIQKMESFDAVNAIASDEVVAVDTLRKSLLSSIFGES